MTTLAYDLATDIDEWLKAEHMGTQANRLRCAAHCAIEQGVGPKLFAYTCGQLGVNTGTALNRYHEVLRQERA